MSRSTSSLAAIAVQLRHARIKGDQLTSPDCPCCGGFRQRYRTALAVKDVGTHLVFTCHYCGADWRDIARMLGVAVGGDHAEACARDEGPFVPDEAVLANVRPWRFTPTDIAFPADEVGRCAQILYEYVPEARRATKRLKHDPDEPVFAVRFSVAAVRIAGQEQFIQRVVEAACRLLKATFETSEYRTKRIERDDDGRKIEKPLLFTVVHVLKLRVLGSRVSALALGKTEASCHRKASDEEALLSTADFLADLRPNPPPLDREQAPSKMTLARFLGQEVAAA